MSKNTITSYLESNKSKKRIAFGNFNLVIPVMHYINLFSGFISHTCM